MLSRRAFLLSGLATSVPMLGMPSWAKKQKEIGGSGPRLIARQDWPPAIAPSQIGITERGICCFTDEYGRLALVDFHKIDAKNPLHVLSELDGLGKKVLDFKVRD